MIAESEPQPQIDKKLKYTFMYGLQEGIPRSVTELFILVMFLTVCQSINFPTIFLYAYSALSVVTVLGKYFQE